MSVQHGSLTKSSTSHRSDIQGLRAVAVLMVVGFHAGLPMPGGFAGVDVFFVISGYVITLMLCRQWEADGSIKFPRFYFRRFKRLLPALALTVFATVIAAGLLLTPMGSQQETAQTGAGAMLLGANFVIARFQADYFALPVFANPLLNTWSLSVEEQVYLVFPITLAIGLVVERRLKAPAVSVIFVAVVSVASFWVMLVPSSSWLAGFYSPLPRVWEFGAGAMLALVPNKRLPGTRFSLTALTFIGVGSLAATVWLLSDDIPWPSPYTLLPVLGTLCLIAAGSTQTSLPARALSFEPLTYLGDRSYSIYLWHWPIICIAFTLWPIDGVKLAAAVLALGPALVSYRYVENPLRHVTFQRRRSASILVALVMIPPLVVSAGLGYFSSRVWRPQLVAEASSVAHPGQLGYDSLYTSILDSSEPCPDFSADTRGVCRQVGVEAAPSVLLVGDSHAAHLLPGLNAALPSTTVAWIDADPAATIEFAHKTEPDVILLSRAWWLNRQDENALREEIQELTSRSSRLLVLNDVPVYPFDASSCKFPRTAFELNPLCTQPITSWLKQLSDYGQELGAAVSGIDGALLLDSGSVFCDTGECSMLIGADLGYADGNHLNPTGSLFLADSVLVPAICANSPKPRECDRLALP